MKKLTVLAVLLAFMVVGMGAYTRLTEAGLGCPDWPGCYGFKLVPQSEQALNQAQNLFPDHPVEPAKAWNEMIHRYLAGSLGLLILLFAIISLWRKKDRAICCSLLVLVIFQALLGMWTVTLNLLPLVVMGHLLGGFALLSLLYLYMLGQRSLPPAEINNANQIKGVGFIALMVLVVQIALGGWTSANYAAVVCTEFPVCEGDWLGQLNTDGAFSMPEAETYQYGVLDYTSRMTIHISHRFWAVFTLAVLLGFSLLVLKNARDKTSRHVCVILFTVLLAQFSLGISNVAFKLPIGIAVAHNLVAALLLLSLVTLIYRLYQYEANGSYETNLSGGITGQIS